MEKSPGRELEDHLRAADAATVQRWIDGVVAGTTQVPAGFNWILFAQVTTGYARSRRDPQTGVKTANLAWAEVALAVHAYLAARSSLRYYAQNQVTEAIQLRIWMIQQLGAVAGHLVLDPEQVSRAFWDHLEWPLAEFTERSAAGRFQPADLALLMDLWARLGIIARLVRSKHLVPSPELRDWLALRAAIYETVGVVASRPKTSPDRD